MVITIHILATDDERLALKSLMNALEQVFPQAEICGFQKSQEALDYAERLCSENKISLDFAFLDVEMPEMTGIELAAKLKKICPEVCIFFVTGFTNYAYDAYRLHAKGYILKPVSAELIKEDLANLKKLPTFEMPFDPEPEKRVYIRTFGTFDIFVDQKPLVFSRTRAKELLAYLVDRRGSGVSLADICTVLFEDQSGKRANKKYAQNFISSLKQGLEKAGVSNILIKKWNYLALDIEKVDCDYYRFLEGDIAAVNNFYGEYMSNYTWAEFTVGFLNDKKSNA